MRGAPQVGWRLKHGDRELFALPRMALLRSVMLNHSYHHRGQLSVYLRELGLSVPFIYGPSADEKPIFLMAARMVGVAPTEFQGSSRKRHR